LLETSTGSPGRYTPFPADPQVSSIAHSIRRLADARVGDIVMFSLFEERLRERAVQITRLVDGPAESFLEALKRPVGQPMPSTMMAI
jgi:hypothetical protein